MLTNNIVASGLLHQIMREPTAAGVFRGTVDANITTATVVRAEMNGDVPADLNRLGQLQGFIELVKADLGSDAAKEEDIANARTQTYFESVAGALGAIPGGRALEWSQTAIGFAAPIGKDQLFPTDNAEKFEAGSQRDMYVALNGMRPQIAQGLITAGKIHPPTDATWIGPDGKINLSDPGNRMRFDGWWERLLANWTEYEDYAQDGFQNATTPSASNDNAHRRHPKE